MEFENRYYETRKTLAHFYGKSVYKNFRWLGLILVFFGAIQIITVVADIMGAFQEPLKGIVRLFFFDLGIILVVLGLLLFWQHIITARVAYRQTKKMGGGIIPETVISMGEDIRLSIGTSKSVYGFGQIYRIVETKEEFALMLGKHMAVRARKGCFTQGDEGEFPAFLRERCPRAKWKRA